MIEQVTNLSIYIFVRLGYTPNNKNKCTADSVMMTDSTCNLSPKNSASSNGVPPSSAGMAKEGNFKGPF